MDWHNLKCTECAENYNDERVPRLLSCGHSLCTPCSDRYLQGVQCPECLQKYSGNKKIQLPVNYPLLRVSRSSEPADIYNPVKLSSPIHVFSNLQEEVWRCSSHGSPLVFLCCSCSAWICCDCLVVDHPFLPRGSCIILGYHDATRAVRVKHERVANDALKDIDSMKKTYDFEMAIHEFNLKYCSCDGRSHMYLVQQVEKPLKELRENISSLVERLKETVNKSIDSMKATSSPEEMTRYCRELHDYQNILKKDLAEGKEKVFPVVQKMVDHLRLDLRMLVDGKEPVYAQLEGETGCRWANITIKENRLLLYSLAKGKPLKGGIYIPFEYVKKLIPNTNTSVFFEVGTSEEEFGRIYVRLRGDSSLTQQVVLMCSGEKSVSYRNTVFHKRDDNVGMLYGGDYENKDGNGGKPIVTGLFESRTSHESYHMRLGAFLVNRISTRFGFRFKHGNTYFHDAIGRVTEGLKILKTLPKIEPATKIMIRNCGIFIPMKVEVSEDESSKAEIDEWGS